MSFNRIFQRLLGLEQAVVEHGLSNARTESTNTRIKLAQRQAFGFRDPDNLIALLLLNLGGHRPSLPGRNP